MLCDEQDVFSLVLYADTDSTTGSPRNHLGGPFYRVHKLHSSKIAHGGAVTLNMDLIQRSPVGDAFG